jgi:hypothetical protein
MHHSGYLALQFIEDPPWRIAGSPAVQAAIAHPARGTSQKNVLISGNRPAFCPSIIS